MKLNILFTDTSQFTAALAAGRHSQTFHQNKNGQFVSDDANTKATCICDASLHTQGAAGSCGAN
jgi:hypothetical protein